MTATVPEHEGPAIAQVSVGMRVYDSAGAEVGSVQIVKMGDPATAVTAEGQQGKAEELLDSVARNLAGVEPDLPPAVTARLLRTGYIKIDGKGLFDRDRYASADQIAGVSEDVVILNVTRDEVATEQ